MAVITDVLTRITPYWLTVYVGTLLEFVIINWLRHLVVNPCCLVAQQRCVVVDN